MATVQRLDEYAANRELPSDLLANGSPYRDVPRMADEIVDGMPGVMEVADQHSIPLLRAIAQGTTDAVFVKDRRGRYVLFNGAAERFVGRKAEEVLGRDDTACLEPEAARAVMEYDRRVMASGATESEEETYLIAGVTRTFLTTKGPYRDETGNVAGVFGIAREISERKRAQSLYRLQDRAIKAVTQGIVITDPTLPDNPIVYVSPGFESTTGYRAEEILGKSTRFLKGRDTDPAAIALIQERLQAGEPVTVELLHYRKDQTPFWNQLSVSPVRDDAGCLTHYVALHTDVTERRRLEDELRQSQKMETVGQLAGGMAHDFNNLLTVITVNAELALENLQPGTPLFGMISEIKRAGELSVELTRRLLTFSRRQVATPQILSLNKVVADTERFLRRLIGEDIALSIALSDELAVVRADPGLIEQALLNLALNARDSMPTGGELRIATRNVTLGEEDARRHLEVASGPYVVLAVSDTGHGMSPEVKARLFEPFFTTKKPGQGTGLGLSTVYGIVKQTGGHINVESHPGVGSTFEIFLPAIIENETPRTEERAHRTASRGNETILVVEDDARVRGLICSVLTSYGYQVLESENGVQAIDRADDESKTIDLIVTDVVLPGMGGRLVAKRVVERQPRAKVLFVSGYADDAIVRHGVLQEQVHFLQKPFTPVELAEKVRETLDATF